MLRDKDGEIQVYHNVCRHRGMRLVEKACQRANGLITYPYHKWSYTLGGELKTAPLFMHTSGNATPRTSGLAVIPSWGRMIHGRNREQVPDHSLQVCRVHLAGGIVNHVNHGAAGVIAIGQFAIFQVE